MSARFLEINENARSQTGPTDSPMPVQFMLGDFAIESIAVHAKNLGGLGLISACFGESALNKSLFELA
jgi:hypothetical protein